MQLSDFDFDLPESLIATRPAKPRSSARLLVAEGDAITDAVVTDLPQWLRPGDWLVLNNTRVIPARLSGVRHRDGEAGPSQEQMHAGAAAAEEEDTEAAARPRALAAAA